MRDASGRSSPRGHQGQWPPQVQLARGHWRRVDAAGGTRSAGWWESVTVTWAPAPAPERPGALPRALAAAELIVPVLADAAVAVTRRALDGQHRAQLVSSRLPPAPARELPGPDRSR